MESASLRQEVSSDSCHNWYSFFSMVVCNLSHRHWIVFPQERNVTVSQYRPRLWWLLHVSLVVLSVSIRTCIRYNFRLVFCNSYYFRLVYATVTIFRLVFERSDVATCMTLSFCLFYKRHFKIKIWLWKYN